MSQAVHGVDGSPSASTVPAEQGAGAVPVPGGAGGSLAVRSGRVVATCIWNVPRSLRDFAVTLIVARRMAAAGVNSM